MGERLALDFARKGWRTAIAARREDRLRKIAGQAPEGTMCFEAIDVTAPDAEERFMRLIEKNGGMDVLLYSAGCGWNNPQLDPERDRLTVETNVVGFTTITEAAFRYFRDHRQPGQIAAITSIAGTRGIGVSATYSATKRYQWNMLSAYDQLAHEQGLPIKITDIRPGFVETPLLDTATRRYPMTMTVDHVAPIIERAVEKQKRVKVVDARWAVVTALWRLIPRCLYNRLRLQG